MGRPSAIFQIERDRGGLLPETVGVTGPHVQPTGKSSMSLMMVSDCLVSKSTLLKCKPATG
jgi:hypothetical protein